MSSQALGNLTSGFIDLATFDEIEKYLYGGLEAVTYFVREVRKSTWFTVVPTVLSRVGGTPAFGSQCYFQISRAGDYLLHTWFRADISEVQAADGDFTAIRWTRNFGHNLIKECTITFNDLVAARFDNYFLDFWAAFTVPKGKQQGYNNMIGNTTAQTNVTPAADPIAAFTVNIPLPLFYTRDSGVALPTAALPYNDMRINLWFRNWDELLIGYTGAGPYAVSTATVTAGDLVAAPTLDNGNIWANYAIVSNDERKRMGCAPRDILIEQVQTAPQARYTMDDPTGTDVDIRFSHSVKALGILARNTHIPAEWSNYTNDQLTVTDFTVSADGDDPIQNITLYYENTQRLGGMPSEFFSQVEPYYKGIMTNIPTETGYHLYSYALDLTANDPMGSTNYGKLTNVSINAAAPTRAALNNSTFQLIILAVNHNIIRISGGALGFPVL